MIVREKTETGWRLIGVRGSAEIVVTPPVYFVTHVGHGHSALFEPMQAIFSEGLGDGRQKIYIFADAGQQKSYDPELRQQWIAWFGRRRDQIGGIHVLITSHVVEMGINLVAVTLGPVLRAYRHRAEFDRAYEACKREQRVG